MGLSKLFTWRLWIVVPRSEDDNLEDEGDIDDRNVDDAQTPFTEKIPLIQTTDNHKKNVKITVIRSIKTGKGIFRFFML